MTKPSFDLVAEALRLDEQTGRLYWKVRGAHHFSNARSQKINNTKFAGKEAFTSLNRDGYLHGSMFSKSFVAHQIVWLLHHKEWASDHLDHINGDRVNNRPSNLRCVGNTLNRRNCKKRADNTSGVTGVTWNKNLSKWTAQICIDGKGINLGSFNDMAAAAARRREVMAQHGFTDRHGT
jgi:hypothetical protein